MDAPSALRVIVPVALIGRAVVALVSWFAKVRAIAAPMAAEPLELVSPCAVVFAVAC